MSEEFKASEPFFTPMVVESRPLQLLLRLMFSIFAKMMSIAYMLILYYTDAVKLFEDAS